MDFEAIYKKFSTSISGLAKRSKSYSNFIDEEDITQEMILYLWQGWKSGRFQDKTDSYILQSLWFRSQNYLRKKDEKATFLSLDEPVNGEEIALKDIIQDSSPSFVETIENKMLIQRIKNNGLTKREKEVFDLRLEGYNLREVGEKLGISYVRAFKIQENIRKKWAKKVRDESGVNKTTYFLLV